LKAAVELVEPREREKELGQRAGEDCARVDVELRLVGVDARDTDD